MTDSQTGSQDPAHPSITSNSTSTSDVPVAFDPLAGLPSADTNPLAAFLPSGLNLGDSTGSASLDEQINAFTAGLVNSFNTDKNASSSANLPTAGQNGSTTDHSASDNPNAAVESLLASLAQIPSADQSQPQQQQSESQSALAATTAGSNQQKDHFDILAQLSQQPTSDPSASTPSLDTSTTNYLDILLGQATADAAGVPADGSVSGAPAPAVPSSSADLLQPNSATDASIAASLEEFMASLQARVTSSLTATGDDSALASPASEQPSTPKSKSKPKAPKSAVKAAKPPKKILGKRKYREIGPMERKMRVQRSLSEYIRAIDPLIKPSLVTGPLTPSASSPIKMTTIRCTHASVAQKSYGSEKRFLNPPPVVQVSGPLRRYADWGPAIVNPVPADGKPTTANNDSDGSNECNVSMLVKGETGEVFSNEQVAVLDPAFEAQVRSLYVTPTGRSKSLRLQLNMLRSRAPDLATLAPKPIKRLKVSEPSGSAAASPAPEDGASTPADGGAGSPKSAADLLPRLPESLSWASFESAPVTIISKSTKKTVKPRSSSAQVSNGSLISLFNRINSQTLRTKYVRANRDGRLTAQGQEWSAFRVTLISRPPQADLAGAEEGSITYGSTIVLTDIATGATTDPLVVCKVDKGQVLLPQVDPPAEILMPGTGYRSRRIPVDPSFRRIHGTGSDAMPMMGGNKQPGSISAKPESNGNGNGNGIYPAATPNGGVAKPEGPSSSGKNPGEDANVYGPVGQLQKVALMRFVPRSASDKIYGDSEHLESDFDPPRSYLCASVPPKWKARSPADQVGRENLATSYANTHATGLESETLSDDVEPVDRHRTADGNSLAFVTPRTTVVPKEHGPGSKVVDEVDDTFVWTVIGICKSVQNTFVGPIFALLTHGHVADKPRSAL